MLKIDNCPYIKCNHEGLAEKVKICPACKTELIWCGLCGSPNQIWATYCRACGGGSEKQKLPIEDWRMLKGNPQLTSSTYHNCLYPKTREMIKVLWAEDLGQEINAPVISAYGSLICLNYEGNLYFLKEIDGTVTGPIARLTGEGVYAPAVEGWNLFAPTTKDLLVYDLRSNHEKKRYPIEEGEFASDIVVNEGLVVIGSYCLTSGRSKVLGFSANLQPLWSVDLEGNGLITTPLFIGNQIIVSCQDGNLSKINDENKAGNIKGKEAITYDCIGSISGGVNTRVAPAFNQGKIYFVNEEGELYTVLISGVKAKIQKVLDLQTGFIYGLAVSDSYICITGEWGLTVFDKFFRNSSKASIVSNMKAFFKNTYWSLPS